MAYRRIESRIGSCRFTGMARYAERITTNSNALRAFAGDLRAMADDVERQAQFMDDLKVDTIEVTHWKTARDAVSGFAAFMGAIKKSIVELKMLGTIQSMLVKQPSIEESQADVLARREQQTRTKKGSAKRKPSG